MRRDADIDNDMYPPFTERGWIKRNEKKKKKKPEGYRLCERCVSSETVQQVRTYRDVCDNVAGIAQSTNINEDRTFIFAILLLPSLVF